MGRIDRWQSAFYESKARFADLWNVCVFDGKEVIKEEELIEADSVLLVHHGNDKKKSKNIADKIYQWRGIQLSFLVLESQTHVDYGMPLRVMINEAASYQKQARLGKEEFEKKNQNERQEREYGSEMKAQFISTMYKGQELSPVITLVLYIGTDNPWDGNTTLHQYMRIPESMKKLVNDYKIHVIDYRNVKNIEDFQTENRLLFELLQSADDKNKMMEILKKEEYNHIREREVINMILGSIKIPVDMRKIRKNKEGEYKMCKAVREWEQDLLEQGRNEGISIGRNEGISIGRNEGISIGRNEGISIGKREGEMEELKRSITELMKNMKITVEQALDLLSVSEERRKQLY